MKRAKLFFFLTIAALLIWVPLGCDDTAEGVGEDMEDVGQEIDEEFD
jgi:predicted small secreted protein